MLLDAEPSRFSWTAEKHRKPPSKRNIDKIVPSCSESTEAMETANSHNFESSSEPNISIEMTNPQSCQSGSNVGVLNPQISESIVESQCNVAEGTEQDIDPIAELHKKIAELELKLEAQEKIIDELKKENEDLVRRQFSLEKIKDDDSAIMFYTGFPCYNALISFYDYIQPKLSKMQYWRSHTATKDSQSYQDENDRKKPGPKRKLSHLDEFFLVLIRLKAGLFVQDIADRFGISISQVSRICITWINMLYFELKSLFPFPSQELVRKNMPKEFFAYSTTRIILDCTELFIQKPSAMLAQSETWSEYKHHNTWKLLVGVTPNGQISFLSNLWGGRVSDKTITRESGVLDMLERGDNVMVDRGFDIHDLVPPGVTVNMPPFLAGREQLTAAETEETMAIASVRIHVERAIGRIKTYHILDGSLPNTLSPYATQIVTVCGLLTNFLPPLLPPANN